MIELNNISIFDEEDNHIINLDKIWLNDEIKEYEKIIIYCREARNNQKYPLITYNQNKYIFHYKEDELYSYYLYEKYADFKRPLYTYLPMNYSKIMPDFIKKKIRKIFDKNKKYSVIELNNNIDLLKRKIKSILREEEKEKTKIIITHDIDTEDGLFRIEPFIEIEKNNKIKSTYFIPLEIIKKHSNYIIKKIIEKGLEVGIHGIDHSNREIYQLKKLERELIKNNSLIKELKIKGYRSPSLFRSENLYRVLSKYFYYDSSVSDFETNMHYAKRSGCCTVFPFKRNNMIIIPISSPIDSFLLSLNYSPESILEIYLKKFEYIKSINGYYCFLNHIEKIYSANELMEKIFEKFIKIISSEKNIEILRCDEVKESEIYTK